MKKARFAEGTTVDPAKTQFEIKTLISQFAYGESSTRAIVGFKVKGRRVRFELPMPMEKDFRQARAREAEIRRLWRCLLLCIKSKFEVVSTGMAIFEEEFMAHIVMPDGKTVAEHALPAIARAYETGQVAGLLGPGGEA